MGLPGTALRRPDCPILMNRFICIIAGACILAALAGARQSAQASDDSSSPSAAIQNSSSSQLAHPPVPSPTFVFSPERRAKAIAYSHTRYKLYFLGILLSLGIYYFTWRAGIALYFRKWADKVSRRLILQCAIFVPLIGAVFALLNLPLDFYSGYILPHQFGLSTQSLASWLSDWGKGLALGAVMGTNVAWVFYSVVRASRRWWFYFWLASIPLVLCFILAGPEIIDPLFNHFTPLQKSQPVLTARIESMLSQAGLEIPPSRIFEMDASSRTKELNAYVSGIGASKRVVIWDTTLKRMDPDQILLVVGHEAGHYVLLHISKEFALDEAVALVFFLAGFYAVIGLVRRTGPRFGVTEVSDLAALPLVLIVFTLMGFFANPIVNGISRHYEHQADQFGLEAAYGTVADPNSAEVNAFQILGEVDLSDPAPSPFIKFWLYSHPPLDERIRFAASYKPWAEGRPMELLPATK
jgi:STE24 endopeptidase